MKKNKIAALGLAAALTLGTVTVAVADSNTGSKPAIGAPGMIQSQLTAVLNGLVSKGTITQAQSDAIVAALKAAAATAPKLGMPGGDGPDGPDGMGGMGGMNIGGTQAARDAVILKALGIDAATLAADIKAGKTLAQIDPTKTAGLITALVAFESANIDAAVTAKTITAAQATTLKAGLTARVTAEVNSLRGPGRGHDGGPVGGMGKKMAPRPGATPAPSIHA